jgi:hypothetical protein
VIDVSKKFMGDTLAVGYSDPRLKLVSTRATLTRAIDTRLQ